MNILNHLLRLYNIIQLSLFYINDFEIKKLLRLYKIYVNKLVYIYSINNKPDLFISESIGYEERTALFTVIEQSLKYISENNKDLNKLYLDRIIAILQEIQYHLKWKKTL